MLAYLARYAHQQIPVLREMPVTELMILQDCIGEIVTEENKPGNPEDRDG